MQIIKGEIKYKKTLQASDDQTYDMVMAWLVYLSGPNQRYMDRYCFTYLDKDKTKVIRSSRETRKIELSDKVDGFVEELIKFIIRKETEE